MSDYTHDNEVVDRIIRTRRTVRQFKPDIPPKELIEQIIEAGRQAPFAALANAGRTDFRHFFVFRQGSKKLEELKAIILESMAAKLPYYEKETDPRAQVVINVIRNVVKNGLPFTHMPWFIIAAERRGFPAKEGNSLSHVMQNMWLKATALGLGFQLISMIGDTDDNEKMSALLGIPRGEYRFDSCIIGYPANPVSTTVREVPHLSIKWFD